MLRLFDLGSQERITAGITADLFLVFFGRQVKQTIIMNDDDRRGNRTEATTDLGQFSHMLRLRLVFNPKSSSKSKRPNSYIQLPRCDTTKYWYNAQVLTN